MNDDIRDALAGRHFRVACALAAKLPDPREHRDAMIEINRFINATLERESRDMRPMFSLEEKPARITKYECDRRVSDDPTKVQPTIAEVTFELSLPSELLAGFDPTLRNCLFHKSGAVTHDLVNEQNDAPDVRFPSVLYPLKFKEQWEGAVVTIHKGLGGKSDLVLDEAAISTFEITPKNGGIFLLEFTSRSKPEQDSVFGRLASMLKTEVTISLTPPAPPSDGEPGPIQ